MKLLVQSIFFASLFVVVCVVESSPPPTSWNDIFASNITRGSSLSTSPSDTSHWLSPSGNVAFGFYKLPCSSRRSSSFNCGDRYVVGIWFVKSSNKTLVWTANRDNLPLSKPSLILFTSQGKLVLRVRPDNKDRPLIPDLQEPISYAEMHDDGNFVLYGSNSQIIWESFDYPTDTILGGQRLKDGVDLVSSVSPVNPGSGEFKLSIRQTDGLVAIHRLSDDKYPHLISRGFEGSIRSPVTLNLENKTGNLFLVDSDGVVLRKLYEHKHQQPTQQERERGTNIYRATLDSEGNFNLFKERIDGNIVSATDKSFILVPLWSSHEEWTLAHRIFYGALCAANVVFGMYLCLILCYRMKESIKKWKTSHAGDLELAKDSNSNVYKIVVQE